MIAYVAIGFLDRSASTGQVDAIQAGYTPDGSWFESIQPFDWSEP